MQKSHPIKKFVPFDNINKQTNHLMKQKNFFLTSLFILFIVTVNAQQVSGTVTDESSEPISGVSIVVKGTSTGTIQILMENTPLKQLKVLF